MLRSTYIVILLAALEGAAGVVLSAAAAHVEASPLLDTASRFLLIHAAAGLALAAVTATAGAFSRWLLGASFAMLAGAALFSGDLAVRAFAGTRLFPYAAPIGGSLLIASWAALAVFALVAAIRADR
ncbi:DUF423 domain-containing protein [Methylosinus sp. Sm6]|uniref:DUF423 domain-containing protein n=1 Tax=Methylosinus sp. Sm6 TaxID=2866948 RepID=UPI001C997DE3|nr:DUF423 domain-containing protein [Methylosinus sp. Sm6]MBY6243103.1 DUF423 domain-containing protein [Methylosinus sp. Sm6]